jgi:hypothetical protein
MRNDAGIGGKAGACTRFIAISWPDGNPHAAAVRGAARFSSTACRTIVQRSTSSAVSAQYF